MKLSDPKLRPPDEWTSAEFRTIHYNLSRYDREFNFLRILGNRCGSCFMPIPLTSQLRVEMYDEVTGSNRFSDVCSVCYDMHKAVDRPYFIAFQREWLAEQKKKKRMAEGNKND